MRSAVLLLVLMAACSRQESRAVKPLLRPPTTHGVVGLNYAPVLDGDAGLAGQEFVALRDGGVDFLWVDLGAPGDASRREAERGARAVFDALASTRAGLRVVLAFEAPRDAGVEVEHASLQQQADEVWREYANSSKFANHYQHLYGRPLLLVSVPAIDGSCAAGCVGHAAWNDRGQSRFTIRFVSAFLNEQPGIADAFGRARGWWSRQENGLPSWAYQASHALPEHVGISLERGLDEQWRRALDVDPAVVTLHGWAQQRRTSTNLEVLVRSASVARLRRSHAVLRDTKTGIWYFRSPPGFTVETTIPWVAGAHYEPVLCDFDGDGVQDLGLRDSSASGRGAWHFKRGPGFKFESEWSFRWDAKTGPEYRALAGDFDGDGFCEIAVRHAPSGVIAWRRPIPEAPEKSLTWTAGAQLEPLAGDFDGDGQTDVALADLADGGVLHSRFGPTFVRENERALAFGPSWFNGDFDGDGRAELARYDFRDHGWGLGRFSIEWRDGGMETFSWASGQNYQVLAGDIR